MNNKYIVPSKELIEELLENISDKDLTNGYISTSISCAIKNESFKRNLTQKELAEMLNITESAISRYMNGSRMPNCVTLVKMAEEFNCTTDYLLGISKLK